MSTRSVSRIRSERVQKRQKTSPATANTSVIDFGSYDYDASISNGAKKKAESHQDLTWRADAKESLSDWTINVTCEGGNAAQTTVKPYHVHKAVLGAGKYRTEYFQTLFKSDMKTIEMENCTSCISLQPSSMEAFPNMLDHIYTGECTVGTENAVALRSLSRYFGIRTLFVITAEFIKNNMKTSNAHIYLLEATLYQDEKIKMAAKDMCAKNFDSLSEEQVCSLSPELLQLVLNDKCLTVPSENLSQKVANYCQSCPEDVGGRFLASITRSTFMPRIHPSKALLLLDLCITHDSDSMENEGGDAEPSLRSRCIEAAKEWEEAFGDSVLSTGTNNDRSKHGYSNLSSQVKVEMMEAALISANADVSQFKKQITGLKATIEIERGSKKRHINAAKNVYVLRCQQHNKEKLEQQIEIKELQLQAIQHINEKSEEITSKLMRLKKKNNRTVLKRKQR